MITRIAVVVTAGAVLMYGAGKQNQNPQPANTAEVTVSNEVAPPGGTVQLKFSLTEPRPISSTGTAFDASFFSIDGVAMSSTSQTAAGIGVLQNGKLKVTGISPSGDLGTLVDYPLLTVTMDVPATAKAGTSVPIAPSSLDITTSTGPLATIVRSGSVSIGGGACIRNVIPGGGTWPAGTVIHIQGMGFSPATRVRMKVKEQSIQYVSPEEIAVTLKSQTTMDGQPFEVQNPDGSGNLYYAYLRGTYVQPVIRSLLKAAEPAFALQTWTVADLGPMPSLGETEFIGLALQNPNPGPVSVMVELNGGTGSPVRASFVLPSGTRVMDGIAELLGGAAPQAGDAIRVTSTSPIQVLGIRADDATFSASPFLPR